MHRIFNCYGNFVSFTDAIFEINGVINGGLYVHDTKDTNRDGDGVVLDCDIPDSDDDAEILLQNENIITDFEVLDTVRFLDGTRPSDYFD